MALNENQKKQFLFGLFGVLSIIVAIQSGSLMQAFYSVSGSGSQKELMKSVSQADLIKAEKGQHFPKIGLDRMDQKSLVSSNPKRDPFDFCSYEEMTDRDRDKPGQVKDDRKEVEANDEPVAPPPPEINIKYAGYARTGDEVRAVFLNDQDIIIGREGEVIQNNLLIWKIRCESALLKCVDYDEQAREILMKGS